MELFLTEKAGKSQKESTNSATAGSKRKAKEVIFKASTSFWEIEMRRKGLSLIAFLSPIV